MRSSKLANLRFHPATFLASRAQAHGFTQVKVLPHATMNAFNTKEETASSISAPFHITKGRTWSLTPFKSIPYRPPKVTFHGFPVDQEMAIRIGAWGPLNRGEVWDALSKSDVLVMGSRWRENAPLVILEARAAGCPVIAPRIGGIPEIVTDGVDEFLFEPNNVASCAEALQRWKKPETDTNQPTSFK